MSDKEKKEILDQEKALEEDELEIVSGGGLCVCYIGGGGPATPDVQKACACIAGGGGDWTDYGMSRYNKDRRCRCWCALYGEGKGT